MHTNLHFYIDLLFSQKSPFFLYSFNDPHIPHGDNSDWEGSDPEDEPKLSNSESEDNFAPLNDTSIDSDENIAIEIAMPLVPPPLRKYLF